MDILTTWSNFNLKIALAVFIIYIIIDGMYASYTFQVTKRKPFAAATTGALIHVLVAIGVLSYVQNYLYIIPLVLGSWVGTFLVVRNEQRTNR